MSESVVAKYGGSSMAQPEVVAAVVAAHPEQRLIVLSAPGISSQYDIKMTDVLYYYGALALRQDPKSVLKDEEVMAKLEGKYGVSMGANKLACVRDDVIDQFDNLYGSLGTGARSLLKGITYQQLLPRRHDSQNMAYYASRGERMSARYFAELTGGHFINEDLIRFHDEELDRLQTRQAIGRAVTNGLFQEGRPTIYAGFSGCDQNGVVRVLGRGGSDQTQTLFQDALDWDGQNWTDVEGVFSGDPRKIKGARKINELTREEVREGAHGGSGVLRGDTVLDLQNSSTEIEVRDTFHPALPGTRIVVNKSHFRERKIDPKHPIVAVSGRALMELTVRDMGMADKKGYLARLLHRAEELGVSIEHLPASQDAATFTFHEKVDSDSLEAFKQSVEYHTVSDTPDIRISEKGVVYVVGEALRDRKVITRTLGRIGVLLHKNDLAFDAVVSHPDSPSLALLVDRADVQSVLALLHEKFIDTKAYNLRRIKNGLINFVKHPRGKRP